MILGDSFLSKEAEACGDLAPGIYQALTYRYSLIFFKEYNSPTKIEKWSSVHNVKIMAKNRKTLF